MTTGKIMAGAMKECKLKYHIKGSHKKLEIKQIEEGQTRSSEASEKTYKRKNIQLDLQKQQKMQKLTWTEGTDMVNLSLKYHDEASKNSIVSCLL